ncbi:hypothetical protein SLITO_v1c10400 [Spiroplasma litorale]|uniref:Uncharacterized protein n=1 Tax=Spiroplasma litorale TaxID=216942 RepID=A0A0K1W385_9MOLU|nr:hypothetical protein [Spiroplasma litorale]AKX34651.1 hypothetical protein SLITO_v1c10400 [Spiroplasma litorale]
MKNKYFKQIKFAFFSQVYFELNKKSDFIIIYKYWWKNIIVQVYVYFDVYFIICTIGSGITNASMATTYILNTFKNIKSIIELDIIDEKICNFNSKEKFYYSINFSYINVDYSKFYNTDYNQIFEEKKFFKSNDFKNIINYFNNYKKINIISSDTFSIKQKNNSKILDLICSSISQISHKYNVNFISFKNSGNCFPINLINSKKFIDYVYCIDNFKLMFFKVFIYFGSNIKWNVNLLTKDNLEFINEIYYFDKDFINFIKKNKCTKIENLSNNEILVNFAKKKNLSILLDVKYDSKKYVENDFYNFIVNKIYTQDNWKNSIKVNSISLLPTKIKLSLENETLTRHINILFKIIINNSKKNIDNIQSFFLKYEINTSFVLKNLLNNELIDNPKLCRSFYILNILDKLNSKLKYEKISFKNLKIYFYFNNNGIFDIICAIINIKNGRLYIKLGKKIMDINFKIKYI